MRTHKGNKEQALRFKSCYCLSSGCISEVGSKYFLHLLKSFYGCSFSVMCAIEDKPSSFFYFSIFSPVLMRE